MKINIEIDRLVLEGYDVREQRVIKAAIEKELQNLVSKHGLSENFVSQKTKNFTVDAGSFSLKTAANPRKIGAEVAQAVHSGLKGKMLR